MSNSISDHQPYRSSYRADVAPLHEALHSPSPLGNILDDFHRQSTHSIISEAGRGDASRYNLSPGPERNYNDNAIHTTKSEYSVFGAGSIASSAVGTLVDGVHNTIAHWKVLVFGQLISFFLAAAGAASEELNVTCNVSVPLTQTALVGGVLMVLGALKMRGWFAGCCYLRRGSEKRTMDSNEEENFCSGNIDDENESTIRSPLNEDGEDLSSGDDKAEGWASDDDEQSTSPIAKTKKLSHPRSFCCGLQTIHAPWFYYFFVGLIAVEARYLIFLAFRYTTFTFIYMMDALAIPSAMVFSKFLLQRCYGTAHILGGIICISGIVVSTISDLKGHGTIEKIGSRSDVNSLEHLKGDMLAIGGAVLLGLDDVLSEKMIKQYGGEDELLFMKWFFGLGISVIQLVFLEKDGLIALLENNGEEPCKLSMRYFLLAVYCFFQVLDMAGELRFLGISEAALLNLSLLTSDLWVTAFSIFAVGVSPSGFYYIALLLIVSGIVLYEAGPSPISHPTPADIKIKRHLETETEHATNVTKSETNLGHVEMT